MVADDSNVPKRVWLLRGSGGISGKILNLDPLRLRLTQSRTNFPNNTYSISRFLGAGGIPRPLPLCMKHW